MSFYPARPVPFTPPALSGTGYGSSHGVNYGGTPSAPPRTLRNRLSGFPVIDAGVERRPVLVAYIRVARILDATLLYSKGTT